MVNISENLESGVVWFFKMFDQSEVNALTTHLVHELWSASLYLR